MAFGRARAQLFSPCDGPIAAALNLHVKGAELTAFTHCARARRIYFCGIVFDLIDGGGARGK
jgi:hypothetical protein